ncbi:hypothetical protein RD792_001004 [Penstemon davidsonii]|uniref:GYF domain-containing protein n=1 Tax=Penstemon davidsonii TaxID=160366 RepID=A0ABR0DMY3_9LAMI|nr:hypothetical protein RD792_001004 [Penstemon davidsonii]
MYVDVQGSDNSIPLSPQWLLPKPGESKTGVVTGENHFSPLPGHANRPDITKLTGIGEDMIDNHRKKDVFRPSVLDMESGRRDRWRDEERDTNSSVRKDRWKEGEREQHSDNRRVERWTDSSGRHSSGEARRGAPGERWTTDSGNKDNHDQRRESKWNTRWGRDDKEAEKLGDPNKEADVLIDKVSSHVPYNGKDERGDGDHQRPWRSSSSYGRGRADTHHQVATPNKQVPTFSHSRGRGESPAPVFSLGRGRVGSSGSSVTQTVTNLQPHGSVLEKGESGHGDPYPLKYSRTRLIDIYRTIDMRSSAKYLDGVAEVPSLTQEDPVGPLAFCAPTPEELVILKGIDKGEIMSSGAPQISKDGSAGRTTSDFMQSRRSRIGSKDDLPNSLDDSKHDTLDNPKDGSNDSEAMKEDSFIHRKNDDVSGARDASAPGYTSIPHTGSWRSSFGGRTTSHDWREMSNDVQKDYNNVRENSLDSPNTRKGPKWQIGDDTSMRRQPPVGFDKDMESHVISQSSPEDLVLFYKDPQGEIQGPFAGSDIISWFESGYFGIELLVRLANTPADSPFRLLGDVMPHLRAKSGPPPGFSTPKPNEIQDISGSRLNYNNLGKIHTVSSEPDVLKNDPRYKHGPTTENENRFLESLMGGSMSNAPLEKFALSEGMQGYGGNSSTALPTAGSNNGDDPYLLAKKMAAERQRSLSNPYSFWPGRDAAALTDTIAENARAQHLSQNVDLLSVLQGLPDRSTSSVNSGWSNFPVQGGLNPLQDKLEIHHNPQSAFGVQPQRLQPQNPSVTNILAQPVDNPSNMLTPEKLLSSGLSQDPQLLSLLQQQYLLQLQSQTPVPSQQLSLLDKLLLLKQQQQKQEEQQQLMRQQQQLLSQVLSEHKNNQRLGEPSFAQLQSGGFGAANVNVDHAHFQQPHDLFQMGLRQAPEMRDGNANAAGFVLSSSVSQGISPNISSEASMNLPHQFFANNLNQRNWDASLPEQIVNKQQQGYPVPTDGIDVTHLSAKANRDPLEQKSYYDESIEVAASDIASSFPAGEHLKESISEQFTIGHENELQICDDVNALGLEEQQDVREQHTGDSSDIKEVKNTEAREVKRSSEKKSKKQKAKLQQSKLSEFEGTNSVDAKPDALAASVPEKEKTKTDKVAAAHVDYLPVQNMLPDGKTSETKNQPGQVEYASQVNNQAHTGRAWKPAPGFKPKSLLEIQQEEQRRAQEEMVVSAISTPVSSMSVSTPWAGLVANADQKSFSETRPEAADTELNFATSDNSSILKSKKSQEALFWDNNKLGETETEIFDAAPFVPIMSSKTDSFANDDFIEAKDTKKSRKKSKAKNAGAKVAPVALVDASVVSNPVEKVKHTRQVQLEKDVLPAVPSGPSFGDFVVWKGEPASPSPAPAWSTDSGKPNKPTSLRDILKEQGKKGPSSTQAVQVSTPQKTASNQPTRGSGPSWSLSSSPAKAASPIQINSQNPSHSKHKVEDDLFWGPLEQQPKSEAKQSDFPQLGTHGSWGNKSTPVKGTLGGSLNKQKSTGGKPADYSLAASASSGQSSQKGKKNASTKNSEAVDFKEWCESECTRLVGSKDTSFLEFCLKQSRAEAEMLLIENLGSFDPDHEFIDKFLNYKDFFPADVLEIASKNQNNRKSTPTPTPTLIGDDYMEVGGSVDGANKGGKKKGKKGKKINPSVLGFNVVSNRIMMGEIQTVED